MPYCGVQVYCQIPKKFLELDYKTEYAPRPPKKYGRLEGQGVILTSLRIKIAIYE